MVGRCTNEVCYSGKTIDVLRVLFSYHGPPDKIEPKNGPLDLSAECVLSTFI